MAEDKSSPILIAILIIAFIIGAFYVTNNDIFPEHSAFDDTNAFFSMFEYLGSGDMTLFSDAFSQGMSFLGLFLILFTLFYFLLTSILQSLFKRKNTRVVLAFTLSLYCFINNHIYNMFLSLNAFAIAFLVFIVVVMILWGSFKEWSGYIKDDLK